MDAKILSLNVPEEGAEALRSLVDLGREGIIALCKALKETGPILASPPLRAKLAQPYMDGAASVEELEDILMGAVYPLYDLCHMHEIEAEELFRLIGDAIKKAGDWPEEYTAKWGELKSDIIGIMKVDVVAVEAKGRELLRDRANRVQALRIFSDVRPLFNDERDKIQANVLTNTLCIKYLEGHGGRRRTSYYSLDPEDLEDLKEQIARAEQKNTLIIKQHDAQRVKTLMLTKEKGEGPPERGSR